MSDESTFCLFWRQVTVWQHLGNVQHYVEPFFGSGAVLLARPHAAKLETVNDADGLLANFWRSVKYSPDEVAKHAADPVNEADLHARHLWLIGQRERITDMLMADPNWHDPKAAGWWVWGINSWIGQGWCAGQGGWQAVDGRLVKTGGTPSISRQMPHLGDAGTGTNRHVTGGLSRVDYINSLLQPLQSRLANVRVACGDWSRVTGPSVRGAAGGVCGIFLDPPYSQNIRSNVYAHESDAAQECLTFCKEHGNNAKLRIVLAGYDEEHNELESLGWRAHAWKTNGGYGNQGARRGRDNASKERLWISPHCLDPGTASLGLDLADPHDTA